jgi:hypothetical protein
MQNRNWSRRADRSFDPRIKEKLGLPPLSALKLLKSNPAALPA